MDDRIYTLREAAERLHMPYRTLRDAVYAGKWPHRYISQRRRLMTGDDIDAVLLMTARAPKAPAVNDPIEARRVRDSIKSLIHG